MLMPISILETLLIVLLIALVVTGIFRFLRLPVILGYLVVGSIVGPHLLAWMPNTQDVKELAEFGVVFLMFTVGLEFSLSKLFALRQAVFILGGLQVILSICFTMLIAFFLNISFMASFVIASIVSLSSTAIVIKQLTEQYELNEKHGLNAVGILLFQDLAVIPILVIIANVGLAAKQTTTALYLLPFIKSIIAILIILSAGRWLLRPFFKLIAASRVIELFTLSVIFVAVGAAWLTHSFGLSYALGAFLAGIMLGETEYRHQIELEIRPFRDVLLGLFFISIGMLVNITTWSQTWVWILLLLAGLVLGKFFLIYSLSRITKVDKRTSFRTSLLLAQGGEFGFAILTVALTNQVIPPDWGQSILAALLISFLLTPIIIRNNFAISHFFFPANLGDEQEVDDKNIKETVAGLNNHIIVCGYGRVGQNIARFLQKVDFPFIAVELDPELIQMAKLVGDKVFYGNAAHPEILKALNLDKAKAIVISFDDMQSALHILDHVRLEHPTLPVLVRAIDEHEFEVFKKHGASMVVTEIFEESLTLVNHLLRLIHIPEQKIRQLVHEVRAKNYELLYQVFPGSFAADFQSEHLLHEHLRPVFLSQDAFAIGKTLKEISLHDIEIVAIRRGAESIKPSGTSFLKANDILIVYGTPEQLENAEKRLLAG